MGYGRRKGHAFVPVRGGNARIERGAGGADVPGSEHRHGPILGERCDRLPGDLAALLKVGHQRILRNVDEAEFHPKALRPAGSVDLLAARGQGPGVEPKPVNQIEVGLRRY